MNNKTILITAILLFVAIVGIYVTKEELSQNGKQNIEDMLQGNMMSGSGHDGDIDISKMNNMMSMTVSSEREFIEGMIPHHQEAIDTAKEVMERGGSTPEIKKLVEGIIIAQESEIVKMKQWYQDWYGEKYTDYGNYVPMMRELENLSGFELDKAFLEDMIKHHMGAIMMSKSVKPYIEHNEISKLTKTIISTQSSEIMQMREMLMNM